MRTLDDAVELAEAGVARVVMGSAAISDPSLVAEAPLDVPVAVGLDHRNGELAVHGWTQGSGRFLDDAYGLFPTAAAFVITDIARDGMLTGPDVVGLTRSVELAPAPVIASGGVSSLDDIVALSPDRRTRRDHHRQGGVRGPVHRGRGTASAGMSTSPMKVARVIPCLDVTAGRVVKGTNFVDLRDAGDPVELAARYDLEGADELVFLDITASSDDRATTVDMVRRVAEQVYIPFTVGGGIRTLEDARRMLRAGADKVSVNTAAVQRPELISEIAAEFGAQCVVCAIDAKRRAAPDDRGRRRRWEVFLHGGRTPTGIDAVEWAPTRWRLVPARSCSRRWTVTARGRASISSSRRRSPTPSTVPVIASGGVGTLDHLVDGIVARRGRRSAGGVDLPLPRSTPSPRPRR